jgi:integrase
MTGLKITKRVVDGAAPKAKRYTLFDAEVKGFGLRVFPSGSMSYVFEYRASEGGRTAAKKRVTIGNASEFTPDEARKLADKLRAQVKIGEDPQGAKSKHREAISVGDLVDAFIKEHVTAKRKANTLDSYEGIAATHIVPRLGKHKAKDVTPSQIAKLHYDMRSTPSMANKCTAVLSSMFSFGMKTGLIPKGENPTHGIEKYKEDGVERYLSTGELERLGNSIRVAETSGIPWEIDAAKKSKHVPKEGRVTVIGVHAAAAIRLLVLTGARLREILHLRWENVDLERGMLFLADSKTRKKTIVLNAPSMEILSKLPRIGSYVIAGEYAGTEDEKPRSDLKRPWQAVRRHADLEDLRIHDLRHNFASFGAGGGMGLPIIGKLLGHSQAATTQRYAHLDADPVRQASEAVSSRIVDAMGDTKRVKDNVVALKTNEK